MRSATRFFPLVSILAIGAAIAVPAAQAKKAEAGVPTAPETGPAADYPVVLGNPFVIDGKTYTPADTMNYDAVGYATMDSEAADVSAAHRTLPLPSYVEVTALDTGRTILARVTRRGPMSGDFALGLSAGAWKQLGLPAGGRAAIRVRRVNPPEAERALLRLGKNAPERMETPSGLLNVLRRRLNPSGDTLLSGPAQPAPKAGAPSATAATGPAPDTVPTPSASPRATAVPRAVVRVPMPASTPSPAPAPKPVPTPSPSPAPAPAAKPQPKPPVVAAQPAASAGWAVQVAAMSTKARAEAVAKAVGGTASPAGRLWRVRMGPFATRAEADAALAKARSAGYADARVQHQQ